MEGGRGGDNADYKDEAKQRDQEKTTSQQPCRCQVLNSNLGKLIIKCRFRKMIIYVFIYLIFWCLFFSSIVIGVIGEKNLPVWRVLFQCLYQSF